MIKFFLLFLASGTLTLWAQDSTHTGTVTLSAGGLPYSNGYFDEHGGPTFSRRYEFRLWKYLALETGVDTLLPRTHSEATVYSVFSGTNLVRSFTPGCYSCLRVPVPSRTEVTVLPFGLKGILPVASGRLELFAGFGGAYAWHADSGSFRNAFLRQASIGGRIALDHKRRYWLGTSVRGYMNSGDRRQEWLAWTADFGFRFGH